MHDARISRRGAVLGLAALPFASLARAQSARYTFRAIEVDVSPLRAQGDAFTPVVLAQTLPGELARTFASYMGKSGYILRARVDHVSYGPTPPHPTFFNNSSTDYIDGAALVVGPGGKVVASYPLNTFVDVGFDPNSGSAAAMRYRAIDLAGVFARWLPGQMGL